MDMKKIFVFNMKKYRKKRQFSQEKLAEMLNTSTSYIGEIEINKKIPSMDMVEKIANALNVEPFRLFIDDKDRIEGQIILAENYLENLSTIERHDLTKRLITAISKDIEQILQPENASSP
jgi:transcriptional regulator with XRE-family HTH domain